MGPVRAREVEVLRQNYDRASRWFDLAELPFEALAFGGWRRRLWERVQGPRVLEIGVGTGKNIPFYPTGSSTVAVDVSPAMLVYARERAGRRSLRIEIVEMDAHRLEFADNSFDNVVSSFVFCSIPDPAEALREAHRVLRPGGRAFFLEHVRSGGRLLGPLMDRVNPTVHRLIADSVNRDTRALIEEAGFTVESDTHLFLDVVRLFEIGRVSE